MAAAEYEEYQSSQKTDVSSIGFNLSQHSSTGPSTENSDTTVQIKFSRRERRKLVKKIGRKHANEHQNDIAHKLKCHNFKDKEKLGRTFVFAMLWLALNQVGDSLQISDLIRYARESHIKLNNISSFFPAEVDCLQAVNHFKRGSNEVTNAFLRTKALLIAQVIGIRNLMQPDLGMLCERYCKDLCLPPMIAEMVKRLLAFHPPEMKMKETSTLTRAVPNYEGRAMAYIIFILKLFFGVDDQREKEISTSAQVINDKLIENDSKQPSLFVWTEWVEYIEMRNVILSQCHYPTAMQIDPNTSMPTSMYVDFLKRNIEESTCQESYRKSEMENIREIFNQIAQKHEEHEHQQMKPSCHFQPSLTPFATYMEQINADRSIKSKIYIPEFMSIDHEKRDILPYIKPKRLSKIFQEIHHRLDIKEIGFNKNLQFSFIHHENSEAKKTGNVKFEFDVTRAEWIDLLKERDEKRYEAKEKQRAKENEEIRQNVVEHLTNLRAKQVANDAIRKENRIDAQRHQRADETGGSQSFSDMSSYRYFDEEEKEIIDNVVLNEPRRNLDKQHNMLDYESSSDDGESSDNDESVDANAENTIKFIISNFDYWIAMQNIYLITNASFVESINQLPKSFQWLLKQCALQTNMHIKDLYIELLAIENQYRYILKPIFKMESYIKFRKTNNTKLDAQIPSAVKNLKRIW